MLELWGVTLSNDELSMLLDGLLLLVMAGLWWLWWQQARQRKSIELKLVEAAGQLQEATRMLDDALQQIARVQGVEPELEIEQQAETTDDVTLSFSAQSLAMSDTYKKAHGSPASKAAKAVNQSIENVGQASQSAQILRMQREGESPETIASKMNIPLAQVTLMLMLQKHND